MVKINIIGDALSESGYGAHTRGLAFALDKLGANVSLETQAPNGWERNITDERLLKLLKSDYRSETNIAITVPNMWPLLSNRGDFYGFAIFEGTKAPVQWVIECIKPSVKGIFVPSEHTKLSLINAINSLTEENCEVLLGDLK